MESWPTNVLSGTLAIQFSLPAKAVKVIRTADIVRLVFHTLLMVGAVIMVIIAIYNGAFGMAIITAVLVSTIPFVLSILSLVWQGRMKGAAVNDEQMKMDEGKI